MKNSIKDLENLITLNLQTTNNLKNEVEKKENEKLDQLKDISLGIIETLDSFDKVDEWLIEKGLDKNDDSVKTKKRYGSVKSKLLNLLQKYGISLMVFPDGIDIIGWSEPVETITDETKKNNEIVSIVKNGYIRGKEVIRAAQVIIVKN
jgi:molecular chaperone GrpE (heat shock protein)